MNAYVLFGILGVVIVVVLATIPEAPEIFTGLLLCFGTSLAIFGFFFLVAMLLDAVDNDRKE